MPAKTPPPSTFALLPLIVLFTTMTEPTTFAIAPPFVPVLPESVLARTRVTGLFAASRIAPPGWPFAVQPVIVHPSRVRAAP